MTSIPIPVLRLNSGTQLLLDLALFTGVSAVAREQLHDLLHKELENAYVKGYVSGVEYVAKLMETHVIL